MNHERCRGVAFFIAVVLIARCEWRNASRFDQQLRCGMTPAQVRMAAEALGTHSFRPVVDEFGWATHAINEGRTVYWLRFERERLVQVQRGTERGLTGTTTFPAHDLCSGSLIGAVMVAIHAAPRWIDASVAVDGARSVKLSGPDHLSANVLVAAGTHDVVITKPGLPSVARRIVVGQDDSGTRTITLQ